jgi:acid phosphatase
LIVTFDENAGGTVNPIPTIILGDHVRPGSYDQKINHYTLLRTIEDAYGLPALGNAAAASPLSKI